jgi:CRISPR-associated protein Cas2
MSRLRYLVSYDISNPKRLRKVARALEGFGVRLQYSVFECPLDGMRLAKLKMELQDLLNHDVRSALASDNYLILGLQPGTKGVEMLLATCHRPSILRHWIDMLIEIATTAPEFGGATRARKCWRPPARMLANKFMR